MIFTDKMQNWRSSGPILMLLGWRHFQSVCPQLAYLSRLFESWITRYPPDKCHYNKPCYQLNSDLSDGLRYPLFEQPGPGVFTDEDECQTESHNCDVNAQCNNTFGSFNCLCLQGYFGDGIQCSGIV